MRPLTLMPPMPPPVLPAGLIVPIGDAFLWRPPVEPIVPRPVCFCGIIPPPMPNPGDGELPRFAGLAGKTTTLAPEPPPVEELPP